MQLIYKNAELSQILKELIKTRGLSVSEFSRKIDIPQPTIQRIASGKHIRPHQKNLEVISKFFDISIDQLCGVEPIPWLKLNSKSKINQLPLIDIHQLKHKNLILTASDHVVVDINVSAKSYAIRMPDSSMEPLIQTNSILIVDPEKIPQYKNFIVVKIKNYSDVLIRQLIKDANNYYIKPLSRDFEQIKILQLNPDDIILGVVVEIRLYCE